MDANLQVRIIVVGCVLAFSALALSLLHWFPWPKRPACGEAYALGTAVLVGAPVATMVLTHAAGQALGQLFWAGLLVANAVIGGATLLLAYGIDKRRPVNLEDVHRGPQR